MKYKFNEVELRNAIKISKSYAATARALGIFKVSGGTYRAIKQKIIIWDIDAAHFVGRGHLKGKTHNWTKKRPLKDILIEKSDYTSTTSLKRRLLKENLLEPKCYSSKCPLVGVTLNRPLLQYLHLDHINGNFTDNRLVNLRLLCPLCHMDTPTYSIGTYKPKGASKHKKKKCPDCEGLMAYRSTVCQKCWPKKMALIKVRHTKVKKNNTCLDCNEIINRKSTRCPKCAAYARRKINWPPMKDILSDISNTSVRQTAIKLGVSFNGLKKHIKNNSETNCC